MNFEPYMVERSMLALLNAGLCVVALVIIACRLNSMDTNTRFSVRAAHAIGAGAMVYSMASFSLDEWPDGARVALSVYVLCELWASRHAWRGRHGDQPPRSASNFAPPDF